MTIDSGNLEYDPFHEKKLSSAIIMKLNDEEKEQMRKYKKRENRGDYVRESKWED